MPSGFMGLDGAFPTENGNLPEQVSGLRNYVFMLLENLRYVLNNLGTENFNDASLGELAEIVAGSVKAETIISNTVITNELYADYGQLADMTVWKLRTDYLRAQNYLNSDRSQLDYIYIHDECIEFITASVNGSATEQLTDDDGRPYYWKDVSHTAMTSEQVTSLPVTVYTYTEMVKLTLRFENIEQNGVTTVTPVLILGAGTGSGDNGKAKICKKTDGLYISYKTSTGGELSVAMTDDGYVDINRQRKPTAYDFSGIATGSFTETVDGGTTQTYTVTTDTNGDITSITDESGHVTSITW